MSINDLTDDLLVAVLAALSDSTHLRIVAVTCKRWAALMRQHQELWRHVQLELPPKRSRGRDRRNSYTTPCALDLLRMSTWLTHRATAVTILEVSLLYPDAQALLSTLLPPLTPALRHLVLRGSCSDWPFCWVDWRWLADMTQVERLEMWNAVPGMGELVLPPSLTELVIDRVGECDPDTEGWDELPTCFTRLTRLRKLALGTAATYLLQADEESAFTPLCAASGLCELRLTEGALSAVPDVMTALTNLTLLSFRGCDRLEAFGEMCQHKADPFQPLVALIRLRCLDFSRCALERLPPGLGGLTDLRTLLLSDNQLTALPVDSLLATAALRGPGNCGAGSASRTHHHQQLAGRGARPAVASAAAEYAAAAPLPPQLERFVLAGNCFANLPAAALSTCSRLLELDVSRCWQLHPTPAEWRSLLASLPHLCLLRHSCPLLAAEQRGHGGAARLAAAVGSSPKLHMDFLSTSGSQVRRCVDAAGAGSSAVPCSAATSGACSTLGVGSSSKRARSCGSLLELEAAASTLLSAGLSTGTRATLAELAATCTASSGTDAAGGHIISTTSAAHAASDV